MLRSKKDRDPVRCRRLSRSSVGSGIIARSLERKIAKCHCDVHQPQPECSIRGFRKSDTLLSTLVTRTLCLWKNEKDNEYHLTIFREDRDELFLDLHLSGVLTGKLTYGCSNDTWHEVTIRDGNTQQLHQLSFNLKTSPSDPSEVRDFNKKLHEVFEIIQSTGTETKKERAEDLLAQEGRENPAIQYEAGHPGAEKAFVRSMSSVSPVPMATSKPQAPLPKITIQQMSVALAAAIQAGNVKKAQELASVLAQNHTHVDASFDAAMRERKAHEQEISVTVHVEDRETAGLILDKVKVRPSDTILDLKQTFLGKYGFPPEVQKWIIGKRICKDEETLSKCEVNCSGHTLYLYLLRASAVNISREDYKRQWHPHAAPGAAVTAGGSIEQGQESGVYQSIHVLTGLPLAMVQTPTSTSQDSTVTPPQGQGQQGDTMRQQSQLLSLSSSSSSTPVLLGLTDLQGNLDPGAEVSSAQQGAGSGQGQGQGGILVAADAGQSVLMISGGGGEGRRQLQQPPEATPPQEQELSLQGWQCESCTLINQPTRPGCEACGGPRPADYRVPEGYEVSEEERQRLLCEQQLDALMQQTSGQTRSHGRGQGGRHQPPPPSQSFLFCH